MADPTGTPTLRPWNDWLQAYKRQKPNATDEEIKQAHTAWDREARKAMGEAPPEAVPRYLRPDPLAPGGKAEVEEAGRAVTPPAPLKPEVESMPHKALRAFRYLESLTPVEKPIAEGVRTIERPFEKLGGKVTEAIDPMRVRHATGAALARRGVPKSIAKQAGRAAQWVAEQPGGLVSAAPQLAALSVMPEVEVPYVTKAVPKIIKWVPGAFTKGAGFGPIDVLSRSAAGEAPPPTPAQLGKAAMESGKQFVEFEAGEKALRALGRIGVRLGKAGLRKGIDWFEGSTNRPVTENQATPDQPTPPVRADVDPAVVKEANTEETPATHGKKEPSAAGLGAQNERTDKPGSGAGGTDPDDPGTHPTGGGATSRSVPPASAPGDIRESDAVPETAPGPGSSDQFKPRPTGPIREYFKQLEQERIEAAREAERQAHTAEVGPRRGMPRNIEELRRQLRGAPEEEPVSRAEQQGLPRTLAEYLRAPQAYRETPPGAPGEPGGPGVEPAVTGDVSEGLQRPEPTRTPQALEQAELEQRVRNRQEREREAEGQSRLLRFLARERGVAEQPAPVEPPPAEPLPPPVTAPPPPVEPEPVTTAREPEPVEPVTKPVTEPELSREPPKPTAEQLQSVVRRAADEMRDAATGTKERGHYRGELRRAARVLTEMLGPEEAGRYVREEVGDGSVTRALEDILGDQLKRPKPAAPGGRPGRGVTEAKPTTTSVLPTEPVKPVEPTKPVEEAERAEDEELGPRVAGREGTVHVEDFPNTPFRYEVVERSDLSTSHDTEGNPNPDYPENLQQRALDRDAYQETQRRIKTEMAPERLGEAPSALEGSPVVAADSNVVYGGKQRTAALQALEEGSAADETYQKWLYQHAADFGIDRAEFEGFARPTLIRRLLRPLTAEEAARFAPATDVSPSMELSPSEKASVDAKRLTPAILEHLDVSETGNLNTQKNLGFIRAFMAQIPGTERGRLVTAEGYLNSDGLRRVQNAVLTRAYNTAKELHPAIARMFESTDERTKTIQHALLRAAPDFAVYRGAVDAGDLDMVDTMTPLLDAASTVAALRNQGLTMQDWLAQEHLGGKDRTHERAMQMFADNTTVRDLTDSLKHMADVLRNLPRPKEGQLFEKPELPTPLQVFDLVRDPDLVSQDTEAVERRQQAIRDIDREIRTARATGDFAKAERLEEQKERLKKEEPC